MPEYRGTADRPDRAKAIVAVALVHAALAFIILSGLNVEMVRRAVDRLTTIDIRQPPPPPQPPPPLQPPPEEPPPDVKAKAKAEKENEAEAEKKRGAKHG